MKRFRALEMTFIGHSRSSSDRLPGLSNRDRRKSRLHLFSDKIAEI